MSYVLNGTRRVAEETRQRVVDAVRRLSYRPNMTARNLQAGVPRLFGYTWRPIPTGAVQPRPRPLPARPG